MRLLVEGLTVRSVAETLRVDESTVRVWRDSEEGRAALNAARAARAEAFRDTVDEARTKLKSLGLRAVEVLENDLDSADPEVRNRTARTILDRVGLPRTERVETVTQETADYSGLTDEEFQEMRRLRAKVKKT